MAEEGEGEVQNVNGELRIGGGRGRGGKREEVEDKMVEVVGKNHVLMYFQFLMKIPHPKLKTYHLPSFFHSFRNEDPKTFLFEFEVLCRSYDYILDPQKFKLFPATLKYIALKWFMGLGTHTIRTLE